MIASWRGLAVASAIALVLGLVVALDLARTPGAIDRALAAGFDQDRVTELVWERAGRPAIRVVRAGDGWSIAGSPSTPADPGAIGDVLAALRGARWHRAGSPTPVHATLTVIAGATRRVLGLGEPLAGAEQAWIVDGDRGLLVDSWVTRALDRDLLALRIKAPLADVARAPTLQIEDRARSIDLRVAGHPRRIGEPAPVLLAAELAAELERALRQIAVVRLPDGPVAPHGLAITAAGDRAAQASVRAVIGGSCPGAPELIAISGSMGDGCVERTAADALERAVARLRQPPAALVERRPIPSEPARIVLGDGASLDVTGSRIAERSADPARVAELLAALAAPAEVAALPAARATQHLVVTDRSGAATTLDLFAERVLARRGEPIALRPGPGPWSLLVRSSRELRDPVLWLEEPTTITAVRIDGISYQRGGVIGEWLRQPAGAGAPDAGALDALVAILAAPRAIGFVDDQLAIAHRVSITVTPPAGRPAEHRLELGAPRASGCPARIEADAILLPAVVCTRIAALAR